MSQREFVLIFEGSIPEKIKKRCTNKKFVYPETFGITITISRLSEDEDKKLKIVKKMLGYLRLKQVDTS